VPTNTISHAYFRDQDSANGKLGGSITIKVKATEATQPFKTESIWVYWADAEGNKSGEPWLKTEAFKQTQTPSSTL
jgi:vibriolysin